MRNRLRAFTYVELTIVAAIIAILAAIAVPNFLEAQVRATVSRSQADMVTIKLALDAYRLDKRMYPLNSTPGVASASDLVILTTPAAYMGHLPEDLFAMPLGQGFRYYNALQVAPETGLNITSIPKVLDGQVVGLIFGYGPAGVDLRPGHAPERSTKLSVTGDAELSFYDSTNGTKSSGDLYVRLP